MASPRPLPRTISSTVRGARTTRYRQSSPPPPPQMGESTDSWQPVPELPRVKGCTDAGAYPSLPERRIDRHFSTAASSSQRPTMNEMRSDSEYSLPSVEHYEGGVSGMAGVGAGRGRSNTLVVGLDQKRRSRSASRAPTPTIMMSAPVEEEWKATPRDTRRRSRSVTKIIQRDAVQAEQVLASLAPAPFAGRQRSASVSRATDNASLPPHLQSSSTNEFSLAPEPVTRQRARSVSRPNFETPSPIANASAGPSVLSLNEQPTRPRTRSRSKSHCPPPAGGKVPMPLTPDRFQRGGGSTGVSPVGTPNFASAASSPGRPSTPVRTQASDVPTRRRADTVSARASALSILEGPSPTRQREQRLQNPRLGELSDSTLPIRHQSQGFPSLRHQASSSSLNDNQAVPRRPPRSARRQSILPPLRTGRDTPENSPVLKSPLATQTPIIMHVDVEETIASEAETYNAAAGETETEDDRLMTAPAPAPAPAPRVDEPLMTESEDLEWEMMTTGPADDTTAAIETWRRLAESFEKGNPDEEIKVLSDGEGPGYTIVKNYQAQQRPQSTTVHVANHIHAANEPYPEVGASASASASPSRRILAEEALAAERRRVSKQFLLSESSPAKRTSVHERERERLSSPRSKRLSSMVSARPTLSTKSSPPFIPEKTSDSAPHDYDFPTSKAARSPRSPRCFQPYVWAGSRSSVAESESEAGPSTPVPGAFPSMADQALDALDQPLPLLLSGGSAAAARSSGSGSKTDVCQQAGMALSSFGTGLGLYFPDEEGSGRRLDQAHAEPHPAAAAPLETWTTQLDSHDSISVGASDSDASSRTGSECYESADEGDEGDWNSRRGSRASMAWFDAAEAFERQHGCARGSAGWRTSVRFSLDRRMSFVSPEADRKRLSVLGHQRESRAMQMPAFDEVAEYTALAEEEVVVEPREEERMVEPPCTNEVEEDEAQTPVLSRPASQSTVEDTTLLTPRLETHDFDLALPLPNRSPGSPGEHEVEMFEKEEVKLELGDVGGGADSDPEQHRLSTFGGAIRKREPSRRWSALPTERASAVFEADNSTLGADGGGRRSSRRISRSGTTGGRVRGSRTSAQARKRLTAMVATTPLLLVEPPSHSSWRSTLAVEKYEQLLEQWGPKEMHRQEVIWELCETERSFVQALCSIQRVFALPLRTPEGRWINGVPCSVARLFDWLEDILQFHSKVSSALQRARAQQQPLVVQIADSILKYIPRLEVHQPYLVRFETVTATIEEMLRTSDSVFGQFLKMQMLLPECGSMSFSSFLLKPVQRLMKYPLFFKQLFELTPPSHPDHHATQSLHQATDQLIRDMNDVKAREEDYAELKDLETRVRGLPEGFHLASRERRLLRQGPLRVVQLSEKEKNLLGIEPRSPEIPANATSGSGAPSMSAQNLSKLMPITNTEYRPLNLASVSGGGSGGRASPAERNRDSLLMGGRDSIWSNSSAGSGASFKSASYSDFSSQAPTTGSSQASSVTSSTTVASFRPDSVASSTGSMLSDSSSSMFMQNLRYGPTTRPVTPQLPMSMTMQMQNFVPPVAPAGSSRVLSRKPSVANMLLRGTKHVAEREQRERERDSTIHAFVFSDLVLLTTIVEEAVAPSPKLGWNRRGSGSSPQMEATRALPRYNVLEKCGLARVLSVVDHSGKSPERPYLIELEVLPIKVDSATSNMYDKRTASGGPTSLFLSFSTPAGEHPSFKSAEHDCALWSRALERSFLSSLRSTKRYSILSLSHVRDVALAAGGPGGGRAPQQTAHADWPRRAPKVTELVMAAARAGDRTNLVSLLQSGLPFPKSPSQQDLAREASEELNIATQRVNGISAVSPSSPGAGNSSSSGSATANSRIAVVGDSVLDEVEEEREERRWWALRLSEVRQELSAEKEIDSMVESLRSENYNKNQTVNPMEVSPRLGGAPHARRRVRQGLPVLRNVAHQPSGASNGQASAAGKENVSPATTSGGLFRGVGSKRR